MGEKRSNYLIQGTILAAASIFARILGMLYRFPLARILTDEGNAYYQTANSVYTILLMISTFSLPLAVSKLVSEKIHQGEMKNAQRIFHCSMKFALVSGGVMALLTFAFAGVICSVMKVDNAVYALRILAPAVFIYAIVGVLRGFFQGHESMIPTAVSQVIEQIVHVIVAVAAAIMMVNYGNSLSGGDTSHTYALGAAGATSGTTVSVAVSLVFLAFIFFSFNKEFSKRVAADPMKKMESDREIYYAILATILPVILSTVIYNITPTLDQAIFNRILSAQGYTQQQYNTIYGIYSGKFYVLMNVPLVLASSLAPSVVPPLSAAMVNGDYRDAKYKVRSVMRYTMIITIPCAVGFLMLGGPIMALVFGDWRQLPKGLMQAGSLMLIFFAVSTVSTAVLQGMSRMKEPVKNSAIALVIHLIVLYVLLKYFQLNIYGVIYANTVFALVVCILNTMAIKRYLHYNQEVRKTFLIPLISAVVMGIGAWLIYKVLFFLLHIPFIDSFSNAFALIVAIVAAIFIYLFVLLRLKGVRESEIADLPKGEWIISVLHKIHFLG